MNKKRALWVILGSCLCGIMIWRVMTLDYFYSKELIKAIQNNKIETVKEIVQRHPKAINTLPSAAPDGWNSAMNLRVVYPLTEACFEDNIEMVKLLLQNGADPNANNGLTALSVTYTGKRNDWHDISLLLLEAGASLDYVTDYSGESISILHDIVQVKPGGDADGYRPENKEEVIKAFIYALQNCNHNKVDWMWVLQHCVTNDRLEIVKLLLDEDYCDVNDSSRGMSALMFAVRDSTLEMVELLLHYGADKTYQDKNGNTALDYAFRAQKEEMVLLLQE